MVDLLGNGFSYKEIARQLGVKQRRIKWLLKNHIKEIKDKRDLTRAKGNLFLSKLIGSFSV